VTPPPTSVPRAQGRNDERRDDQHPGRWRGMPPTGARKKATTSFTASAYWKFESIPLPARSLVRTSLSSYQKVVGDPNKNRIPVMMRLRFHRQITSPASPRASCQVASWEAPTAATHQNTIGRVSGRRRRGAVDTPDRSLGKSLDRLGSGHIRTTTIGYIVINRLPHAVAASRCWPVWRSG
jgi:hypothetical protein